MIKIWKLHICWIDYWTESRGLEISWERTYHPWIVFFKVGFKEKND